MSVNKSAILQTAKSLLTSKLEDIQSELNELNDALANETKSSAGDKYETSREMIHQEQEKLSELQGNTKRMLDLLSTASGKSVESIHAGSLVQTLNSLFFISVPLGKIMHESEPVFFISPSSPLAQAFMKKKAGDSIVFNGISHTIKAIF